MRPGAAAGGFVSTGFIRLSVSATLPSCGRPTSPEASAPPPPRRSSRTSTEATRRALERALRRADLGGSVVPAPGLGLYPYVVEHRVRREVPVPGLLGEGLQDHGLHAWRDPLVELARRRRVLVDVLPGEAPHVARERRPARQAVVEKHAHGVDVAPRRRVLPFELLRGHVAGAAHDLAGLGRRVVLLDDAGDAEVRDLDGPFPLKKDVGRLDVTVDDAPPVGVGEREQKLPAILLTNCSFRRPPRDGWRVGPRRPCLGRTRPR